MQAKEASGAVVEPPEEYERGDGGSTCDGDAPAQGTRRHPRVHSAPPAMEPTGLRRPP